MRERLKLAVFVDNGRWTGRPFMSAYPSPMLHFYRHFWGVNLNKNRVKSPHTGNHSIGELVAHLVLTIGGSYEVDAG